MNAIAGSDDYDTGPYSITVPAQSTSVMFDVVIKDDTELESDETFKISIDPSSLRGFLGNRINVFDRGEATVTIVDNDKGKHTR